VSVDVAALARELQEARAARRLLPEPLSSREPGFDHEAGYAVGAELTRQRLAGGRRVVGRKVGFASKAVWRALGLKTLAWGPMYDDTVTDATGGTAALSLGRTRLPKIEPEIVFKLGRPVEPGLTDPAAVLASVDWLALGFEIADTLFADWKLAPPDFVAAFGHHAALVVGTPRAVVAGSIPSIVEELARCPVRLLRNGEVVAEGAGRNILKSPALCLAELASAVAGRPGEAPLAPGDLVSTGSLTEPQRIAPDETWTAAVDGLGLSELTLRTLP
jgi:2-oxo-3-hexenedioate decarboxylase